MRIFGIEFDIRFLYFSYSQIDSKTDFIMTGVVFKSQDWWYGVASKTDKTDITTGTEESDTIDF